MKRTLLLTGCLLALTALQAQTSLTRSDRRTPSLVAPAYFGPNAFPVPMMVDASDFGAWHVELAGEGYRGFEGDLTGGPFAKVGIPLYSDRVNLTLWMPVVEFYHSTEARLASCRVADEWHDKAMSGHLGGDLYVSTDILLLRENGNIPSLSVRAALKTASGGRFECARYYDSPGYFFDATAGKTFALNEKKTTWLQVSASTGFLCWQTDNGRQNDAVMYAAQLTLQLGRFTIGETWSGYSGWENAGDHPMTLRTRIGARLGDFEPYVMCQYGLHDYPFHHLRLGVVYTIVPH